MIIEAEQQDYVNAIRPFLNGCSFRALFEADGRVLLEPGCYLLIRLVRGFEKVLYEQWLANKSLPVEIYVTPTTLLEMKLIRPCTHCGGAMHAAPAHTNHQTNRGRQMTPKPCPCYLCCQKRDMQVKDIFQYETSRMILCETCGNKRCPHAYNHDRQCTNSNDVGQAGSPY